MLNQSHQVVYVVSREEIRVPSYYRRLWLASRNLKTSRRKLLDLIVFAILEHRGEIYESCGGIWICPDIDDVFGEDPDVRWFSDFLKADNTGDSPMTMTRRMERARLIDLYFRIKHPEIAGHFGR